MHKCALVLFVTVVLCQGQQDRILSISDQNRKLSIDGINIIKIPGWHLKKIFVDFVSPKNNLKPRRFWLFLYEREGQSLALVCATRKPGEPANTNLPAMRYRVGAFRKTSERLGRATTWGSDTSGDIDFAVLQFGGTATQEIEGLVKLVKARIVKSK